jgi:hypothetical protein
VTLSTNGLAGTLVYPASTAGASASGAFTLTTLGPVVPSPAPTGTSSIYFTLQFSTTIAFQSGFVVSPVTLPASIPTTGVTYQETIYDSTTGATIGTPATGTVAGQTISFAASGGALSATAGDIYLIVISSY